MSYDSVGERLRNARESRGISAQKLADTLGVARSTVYSWEASKANPDPKNYKGIIELLGITLEELFGLTPPYINLTTEEIILIEAYRKHPELKEGIRRLLEIPD